MNRRRTLQKWIVPKPTCLNDVFFKAYPFASLEGIEIGGHGMSCRQHVKTEGTVTYFRLQGNLVAE